MCATLTVYPDPSSGATTVDGVAGSVSRTDADSEAGWDALLAAAGDFARTGGYSSGLETAFAWQGSGSTWQVLLRYIATLDASALDDAATINSAVWSVYGEAKRDPATATPIINLYGSTPAANNDLAGSDKANVGSTAYATQIAWASLSTGAYNDFTLNATGLAAISKTGITKFAMREVTYDVGSTNPAFSTNETAFEIRSADYTGTGSDPKLVIDYIADITISVPLATINLQGFAPANSTTISVDLATITMTAFAPTIASYSFTNEAKSSTISATNQTKSSTSITNTAKSSAPSWSNQDKFSS